MFFECLTQGYEVSGIFFRHCKIYAEKSIAISAEIPYHGGKKWCEVVEKWFKMV